MKSLPQKLERFIRQCHHDRQMYFLVCFIWSFTPKIPPEERFIPEEGAEYAIEAIDGPAAGYSLTYNSDKRNKVSFWVHTQPIYRQDKHDKWSIIYTTVNSEPCYKIKALHGECIVLMLFNFIFELNHFTESHEH